MMKKGIALLLAVCALFTLNVSALAEEQPAETPLEGGWQATADASVSEETRELLNRAFGGMVGNGVEPVAVLGVQVVAGINTCVLCRFTPAVENPVPYYTLVYVYQDLEGNAELLQIVELDPGEMLSDYNG